MGLLIENINESNIEIIKEMLNNGDKIYKIGGIMMQSEIINLNGRWYPKSDMESEVNRYNSEIIPERRGIGELEHSNSHFPDMSRASHIFETPLKMFGNNVIGEARVMDTAHGKTLKVLIDEKVKFGLSSKATGELIKENDRNIVYGFSLITPCDAVYKQSAPDALANTQVESVIIEMLMENDNRLRNIYDTEIVEAVKNNVYKAKKSDLVKTISEQFQIIINSLKD